MVELTPLMLALLCMYWLVHRSDDGRLVADGLFLNWAVNQIGAMLWIKAGWGGQPLILFWVVDLLTALWLGLYVGTQLSRRAAKWFMPMLALNAAVWALGVYPGWHYYTLLALAYAQVLAVMSGLWGHGLLEAFNTTRHRLRDQLADAVSFITGNP
jgi:hypothetical protein